MKQPTRCLLVHPRFHEESFWNYRATCELRGASYPAAPLGLITVAALLPDSWDVRLIDRNVTALRDEDIAWADLVMTGGMIAQQVSTLKLIDRIKAMGKTVVVGGPDPTSSPHLYAAADHLVLGEAEVTLPRWLADFEAGCAHHSYECGEERADITLSPVPRFELLNFNHYLHVGVQFCRGCPFMCEFCDIIELFGRVPRLKSPEQMMAELEYLYDLGYRGHIDFVDDNFIGNRKKVKVFLRELATWLEEHRWPFEFTTEASLNLADDDELLGLMQETGFSAVFVGVESPDEDTLKAIRKSQNTKRSLADSMRKIYSYGMFVNTGYIVGFDTESGSVADGILHLIESSAVPVNMVGLLFALPNTRLRHRLQDEGRLFAGSEAVPEAAGDQCTGGLNFLTRRPRRDILADYRRIIEESYAPEAYFGRLLQMASMLDCSKKRLRLPLRLMLKDLRGLGRLTWRMGIKKPYRGHFWRTAFILFARYPSTLRYSFALVALYLHFGDFRGFLLERLDVSIEDAERAVDFVVQEPAPVPVV